MDNIYSNKEDDFEFEIYICFEKPIIWTNEAYKLFYSAEVLYEFENLKDKELFDKPENSKLKNLFSNDLVEKAYFNYRVQRMLWGYGFENIFKGIIILQEKIKNPNLKQVPFEKIKSHKLTALAEKAGLIKKDDDTFYLGVLEKCVIWAGRYPLPVNSEQMYQKRASMRSRQELFDRQKKMWDEYISGKRKRMECESDVIHGGIGDIEYEYHCNLKKQSIKLFKNLNKKSNQTL